MNLLKNFFPFNSFSVYDPSPSSQKNSFTTSKHASIPYQYILQLEDFFRFAPHCLEYEDFSTKINPPNEFIASIEISAIYEKLLCTMETYTSVEQVASLCLDICKPYKYPVDLFNKAATDLICEDYEDIFSEVDIDSDSLNYLLLEYLYNNSIQEQSTIPKILNTLPVPLSEKSLQRVSKKFSSQKNDLLSSSSTHPFHYPQSKEYIYNLICYPNTSSTQKNDTTICSIYDFIITAGLLTTPQKDNPFVQFLAVKEKGLDSSLITPNKLKNFLNHFYLNELQTSKQTPTFINVINYIVESITNINLINRLYELTLKNKTIPSAFYLLTNYPLVSTRLKLLDLFCQTTVDASTTSILDIREITCNHSISLIDFRKIIAHQTFFYFPLLINLFHLLLTLQSKTSSQRLSEPILEKNICSVFNSEKYTPLIKFPSGDEMTSQTRTLYHDTQYSVYTLYYEQLYTLIDTNFIYDNFIFCKAPSAVVENITKPLQATNLIINDNEILTSDKKPFSINFYKKEVESFIGETQPF